MIAKNIFGAKRMFMHMSVLGVSIFCLSCFQSAANAGEVKLCLDSILTIKPNDNSALDNVPADELYFPVIVRKNRQLFQTYRLPSEGGEGEPLAAEKPRNGKIPLKERDVIPVSLATPKGPITLWHGDLGKDPVTVTVMIQEQDNASLPYIAFAGKLITTIAGVELKSDKKITVGITNGVGIEFALKVTLPLQGYPI